MAEHSEPYDMACSCSTCSGYAQELQQQEYLAWQQEQEYQQYMAEQQEMDAAAVLGEEAEHG